MLNTDFKKAIDTLQANPLACASLCLNAMEELNEGKVKIIDPSNPFVYLMETSVVMYTNALDRCGSMLNRLYPVNARNYQDLYRHMADTDYHNRFATPGSAPIMFFLDVEEIKRRAISIGDAAGTRKLTISRNSQIVIADTILTFLYPIDIFVTSFGTITVKYDISKRNPIHSIADAVIPSEIRRSDRSAYLFFEVPVLQMEISSTTFSVTGTQGLKRKLKFSDKYFYARAFMRDDQDAAWEEITIRHNPMVIDTNQVCLVLNVDTVQNFLEAQIPQVYKNTGMLKSNVRLDIYSTKGEINVPLFNISDSLFKISWKDHETVNPSKFAAPMAQFRNYKIASDGTVAGGSNGLMFEDLREKVINRSVVTEGYPISFIQLENELGNNGFTTILTKDNVTDREFLASKLLQEPAAFDLGTTAIGTITTTHAVTAAQLAANSQNVRRNLNQITTLPSAVYELVDGKLEILSDVELESLKEMAKTDLDIFINNVNSRKLFYCPYFMVHNFDNNRYTVKPYRLDKPRILSKSIENENARLGFTSSIVAYNIQVDRNYAGYSIYIQINPSDDLRAVPIEDLKMQMRIGDENDRYYYWFNGELVTPLDPNTNRPYEEYYVYRFALPTNWSITDDDELLIGDTRIPFKLTGAADIFTIVRQPGLSQALKSGMDAMINPKLFSDWTTSNSANYFAVIQEQVTLELGRHLKNLWRQHRSAPEESLYQTYPEDVPAVWEHDVYVKDEFGEDAFRLDRNGKLEFQILYKKGEPKLDWRGEQIYEHRAGDPVLDENGNPASLESEDDVIRHYDLVLFDAKYYFATHPKTIEYRESVKDEIDGWMDIIEQTEPELLERTTLYVHPKITEGDVRVMLNNGTERYMSSTQKLNLSYTVSELIANNMEVLNEIKKTSIEVIQDIFSTKRTISSSDIIKALKDRLGDWIIGCSMDGFLEDQYETVSILDASAELAIPKRLNITSNLELIVENDIEISFTTHSVLSK